MQASAASLSEKQRFRAAVAGDLSGFQTDDPAGEPEHFGQIVADQQQGRGKARMQCQQFVLQPVTQLGIECRQGFVQQQELRFAGQCTGQGHPLALAAR